MGRRENEQEAFGTHTHTRALSLSLSLSLSHTYTYTCTHIHTQTQKPFTTLWWVCLALTSSCLPFSLWTLAAHVLPYLVLVSVPCCALASPDWTDVWCCQQIMLVTKQRWAQMKNSIYYYFFWFRGRWAKGALFGNAKSGPIMLPDSGKSDVDIFFLNDGSDRSSNWCLCCDTWWKAAGCAPDYLDTIKDSSNSRWCLLHACM